GLHRAPPGPAARRRPRQPAPAALHGVHAHPAGHRLRPALAHQDPGRALHHHPSQRPHRLLLRGDVPHGGVLELHRLGAARRRHPAAASAHGHAGRGRLLPHHPQHLRHHRLAPLHRHLGGHGADAAGLHLPALLGLRSPEAAPLGHPRRPRGAVLLAARPHPGARGVRGDGAERPGRDDGDPRLSPAALGAPPAGHRPRGRPVPDGRAGDGASRARDARL
ncbi:MAG: hypothetical protein AVDCRST_MAG68-2908, partial [uncultured Gemmatimonadetes bacterium]